MDKTFSAVSGDPVSVRHRVLVTLRDHGPMTRADLARRTGLSPATITTLVRELLADGSAIDTGPAPALQPRTGPRGTAVGLNPRLAFALGVDVGFRTFRVMVCDASGAEVGYAEQRLEPNHTAEDGLPLIGLLAQDAMRRAGCRTADLVGAGIALRGPVDTAAQTIASTGELAGWAGITDTDFEEVLGCPVMVENEANLAALGEHVYGAGRGLSTTITVKMHSGVGAGVVTNGQLVTGRHGAAGELGHVPVERPGRPCRCGKRGCLDTRASIPSLLADLHRDGVSDAASMLRLAADGDPTVAGPIHDAAMLVGHALVAPALLLVPDRVIVVGALARAGDLVVEPIREELTREAVPGTDTAPTVLVGELGDRPTVLGAVALVLRRSGWLGAGTPVREDSLRS